MLLGLNLQPRSTRYCTTLQYDKGACVKNANPFRGTSKEAFDNLKAQNWAPDKSKMVELTYGPQRTPVAKFEPKFVKLEKMILTFDGVIRESMDDWNTEKERVRFVKVLYFLETDTIKVMEPFIENSMLLQGNIVRQGRYTTPDRKRDYTWKDFNIGVDMEIYGRKIHLYDCDIFTRNFLTDAGIEVPVAEPKPVNPYEEVKNNMTSRNELRLAEESAVHQDTFAKFLKYDGKVLRFFGIWTDDRDPENPVVRRIILKYYLADDSVEINQNYQESSGWGPLLAPTAQITDDLKSYCCPRPSFKIILSRQRVLLDRNKEIDKLPCYLEPKDLDNVVWMGPEHFRTDQEIRILGKTFFLAKCDDFTSHFYRERFGTEMPQVEVREKPKKEYPKTVQSHNGLGTYDDTLADCYHPWERPKRKIPAMPSKPAEIDHTILRFVAIMDTPRETERVRRFIVSMFLEDDTIKINEVNVDNSGFGKGLFLNRRRVRKDWGPTHEKSPALAKGAPPQYYEMQDLYIGAKIRANGSVFILMDADEKVYHFMANHPEIYKDLDAKEQKKLANSLKGNKEVSEEKRFELAEDLRRSLLMNYGCSPFPIPPSVMDLGVNPTPRATVEEKLYSANLPIDQRYINKLLDAFTFEGMTEVIEVREFLLKALGHNEYPK